MFKRAVFAILSLAALQSQAQGLTVTWGTAGYNNATNSSVTVQQGGTTVTNGAATLTGTNVAATYSPVTFDATTWSVSGGVFRPGGTYLSAKNINEYGSAVKTAISNGIVAEVIYIGTLVTGVSTKIATYNADSHFDTADTATTQINGVSANDIKTDMAALSTEVSSTKPLVDAIKTYKIAPADTFNSDDVIIAGGTYQDYTSHASSIIATTGGTNTISNVETTESGVTKPRGTVTWGQ